MSRAELYCFAVDLGTGGPKVGFVSLTGKVAWQDHFPVETQRFPGGGAEQDAGEWWTIITDAVRKVLADGTVRAAHVAAVAITGQWDSTVPVDAGDAAGRALHCRQDHCGGRPCAREGRRGPVAGYHTLPAVK